MKKETLINLLQEITPSTVIMQNCLELLQREQVGTMKYGVTLSDAGLSHEQLLQHLLEEQLDAANYTRAALKTASNVRTDYAELHKEISVLLRDLARGVTPSLDKDTEPADAYAMACQDISDKIRDLMFRVETNKLRRELKT